MSHSFRWQCVFLAGALLVALPLRAGAGEAAGQFERTLKVTGPVNLTAETGAGKISVRAGSSGTVRVVGRIKVIKVWRSGSAEDAVRRIESFPPVEQSGNTIRVGQIRERDLREVVQISYEIVVPAETELRANSGLGDIVVEALRGRVDAESGAGNVRVTGVAGEIRAESGLGDIEIRGARGSLRAKTGAGSIHVEGEPSETWRLDTGLGNVNVRLPQTAKFEIYARTGLGSIDTKHPLSVQGGFASSEVRGKVRGGGPLIDISSGAGSIHID